MFVTLDGHDFLRLGSEQIFDALYHLVVELLQIAFAIFRHVFGHTVLGALLEFVNTVATRIAHGDFRFFTFLIALFGEVATTLFGEGRNAQTDHFAVIFGHDAHIANMLLSQGLMAMVRESGVVMAATLLIGTIEP